MRQEAGRQDTPVGCPVLFRVSSDLTFTPLPAQRHLRLPPGPPPTCRKHDAEHYRRLHYSFLLVWHHAIVHSQYEPGQPVRAHEMSCMEQLND